ncbi:hypothetical protein OA046_02860, partial [Candidatus Pelagibacter sp.]|nr:hypothetical protein [Candidatus Pelagibacter sp.]
DKIIHCVGNVQITLNRNRYNDVEDLTETEVKIFSQNGEDGIIDYLISRLKVDKKNFVEIGVGDYRESNTRFLYNSYHPKGLIVDYITDMEKKVKKHVNFWKGDLRIINKQIDSKNIQDVLHMGCNYEIDLFSIDIDSIDYWIIDKLKNNISKIFVAEYNPVFGSELEVSVPNISGFDRSKYHYSHLCYGMSLKALIKLMDKKGYYFIGSNLQKINAFFISKEFKKEDFFKNIKIKSLDQYTDSNIRDSRDDKNNLNYLSGDLKFKEIENCEVVDLKDDKRELTKLKDLK